MQSILKTIEHTLGIFFIVGIFSVAALGVLSLSPVSRANSNMVAGIQTTDIKEIDNKQNIIVEYTPSNLAGVISQMAKLEDGSSVLRINAQSLKEGETVIGTVNLENTNLFAASAQATLTNLAPEISDKAIVILDSSEKFQLNNVSNQGTVAANIGLQANASRIASIKIVALENVNFASEFEIIIK